MLFPYFAMNIHIKFLCGYIFISFRFLNMSGILGHMLIPYRIFSRNLKEMTKWLQFTFLQAMHKEILICPRPHQCLLLSIYFRSHPRGCDIVAHCDFFTSLMTNNVAHAFVGPLTRCVPSPLTANQVAFLLLSCKSSVCILSTDPLASAPL